MNIVLLRLTEYLGHTNPLLCGIAYDEVSAFLLTVRGMLKQPRFKRLQSTPLSLLDAFSDPTGVPSHLL